jgi:hypothetical protein
MSRPPVTASGDDHGCGSGSISGSGVITGGFRPHLGLCRLILEADELLWVQQLRIFGNPCLHPISIFGNPCLQPRGHRTSGSKQGSNLSVVICYRGASRDMYELDFRGLCFKRPRIESIWRRTPRLKKRKRSY